MVSALVHPGGLECGGFVAPGRAETLTGGATVEVRWSAPHEIAADADEAELVLSLDGGRTFPVRISAELSPRATSYRWRVPALATRSARLALRVGFDREGGRERLVLVSRDFVIAADSPEPETLARGASEWWTEQALRERSLRDVLDASVEADGQSLVAPRPDTDADRRAAAERFSPRDSSRSFVDSAAAARPARPGLVFARALSSPLRP